MDNIQAATVDSITYKGEVNLKLRVGNKTVSIDKLNTAEPALFASICKFMTGYTTGDTDIPKFIDLKHSIAGGWASILNQKISLSAANYSVNTGGSTTSGVMSYTGTISYVSVKEAFDPNGTYRIYLQGGPDNKAVYKDLAHIDIAYSDLSSFTTGTVFIVEWVITLSQTA